MNKYILVECSDHDQIYGIIKSDLDNYALQEEIYDIKRNFPKSDYTLQDIVFELNKRGYAVEFAETNIKVEI